MPTAYRRRPSFAPSGTRGRAYAAKSRSYKARSAFLGRQRGYLRRAGYWGRFSRAAGNELKFYDENKGSTTVYNTAAGTAYLESSMNNIPEGTGQSERLGRKCTVTQAFVRGTITLAAATAAARNSAKCRVVLVWDKQCNGAAVANAFGANTGAPFEIDDINSFRNLENSSRFTILYDKTHTLVADGAASTAGAYTFGAVDRNFQISLPKLNIPLEFSGATGGIAEIRSNNLVMMAISDATTAADVSIKYISRLRYKDN